MLLKKSSLTHYLKYTTFSGTIGILAGTSSTLFLYALSLATATFARTPELVYGLPFAGAMIALLAKRLGSRATGGTNQIIDEIHNSKNTLPIQMAPFAFVTTILTHLFGGSAGRESTMIQIGASLSAQLSRAFKTSKDERKLFLMASASAAFASALGTPFAGAVFGLEFIYVRGLKYSAILETSIASFVGYYTSKLLLAPHSQYPNVAIPTPSLKAFATTTIAAICFGIAAILFIKTELALVKILSKTKISPVWTAFLGGCVLIAIYTALGSYRYAGLGITEIQLALKQSATLADPVLKGICTAITLATGFKGGEFIPLVFIGTTLGSALSSVLQTTPGFLGALGFAAVFGAASKTPIACTLMAIEIFGLSIAPYAALACTISYLSSGRHSIYKTQRHFV